MATATKDLVDSQINQLQQDATALTLSSPLPAISQDVAKNRQRLSKLLQLHGYSTCYEALVLLEDHYTNSTSYESMDDFTIKINRIITFEAKSENSIIDSDLANIVIQKLFQKQQQVVNILDDDGENNGQTNLPPKNLNIRIKNVQYDHVLTYNNNNNNKNKQLQDSHVDKGANEFNLHYNFLHKKLSSLPLFQGDFKLTKLSDLTASSLPSIRCICFGLLIKDLSKIDGHLLIDSSGRVPLRITHDTTYRNKLSYLNCMVLVEGVYINPDDLLYAANIGLPPVLLDPLKDKALACQDEKLVVLLKEIYLDEEDVCNMIELLFTGYNSMDSPPLMFILIGDFCRKPCNSVNEYRNLMKKLIKIIRSCDNLKDCHFVLIPGLYDTNPPPNPNDSIQHDSIIRQPVKMPKPSITREQFPVNFLEVANFKNVHLATNPAHIYLGDRLITVVGHSYIKELRKNLLYDMSDRNEELFESIRHIILSNAHLSAGIDKNYHSSMNLWHKPDLLVLADSDANSTRYDHSSSKQADTSFATIPSFSKQSYQFKVYYVNSGEIEESQVTSEAFLSDDEGDEDGGEEGDEEIQEPVRSELD